MINLGDQKSIRPSNLAGVDQAFNTVYPGQKTLLQFNAHAWPMFIELLKHTK